MSDESLRKVPYCPWGLGSQQNENVFRDARAFPGDCNFPMLTFLSRLGHIQAKQLIEAKQHLLFRYKSHHKHLSIQEIRRLGVPMGEITQEQIVATVKAALADARKECAELGIEINVDTINELEGGVDAEEEEMDLMNIVVDEDELEFAALLGEQTQICDQQLQSQQTQQSHGNELFSERMQTVENATTVSTSLTDNMGTSIHKQTACAIVSQHTKLSSDLYKRVKALDKK